MPQMETVLYVPLADNDGAAFSEADCQQLVSRLASVASGSTRRGPHVGS